MTLPQKGEVPEIGSVWDITHDAQTDRVRVLSVGRTRINYADAAGTVRSAIMRTWALWMERAVRVDDKKRGS